MQSVRWRIRLFGRLAAECGDLKVTRFRRKKTGLLLALLAMDKQRTFRREELGERLWPELPQHASQNNLRVALSSLRTCLTTSSSVEQELLVIDRQEVHLEPGRFVTDINEFEQHLLAAASAADFRVRVSHLKAAIDLYGSGLLPHYDDPSVQTERLRFADAYHIALRSLAEAYVNAGDLDHAVAAAQNAVEADPYREESQQLLIQVYGLMGRPHLALQQYRKFETRLQKDFGFTPSKSTQRVIAQISGGSTPPPLQASPTNHGPLPASVPAVRVPRPLTRLIGRENALLQVREMLSAPQTRLVTITGLGGIGKSRLAQAIAVEEQQRETSVCYFSFAETQDVGDILHSLASAFHVPIRPRVSLAERLGDALTVQPVLIVLDDVDRLLPQAGEVLHRLLEVSPEVSCLVTARRRLGIPGEYEYALRPLALPPARGGADEIAASASVRLWLDCVKRTGHAVELTDANRLDVAALCRRLEGIPLAIEFAAGLGDILSPAEVEARLSRRFELLIRREPVGGWRHASMLAALDSSFDTLEPEARALVRMLTLFPGSATLQAVIAVCNVPNLISCLAQLYSRSLVYTEEAETETRYRMLDTVREYAEREANEEQLGEARTRFVDFFLALAEEAEPELKGPNTVETIERITRDYANLRTALDIMLKSADTEPRTLRYAMALYRYWYIRGLVDEGRQYLEAALARTPVTHPKRAAAMMRLGILAYGEGDWATAESYYMECRTCAVEANDHQFLASVLGNLSLVRLRQGDPRSARALVLQTLRLFESAKDVGGQALTLGNLAHIAINMDDNPAARQYGYSALALFRSLGDQQNVMISLANLSTVALRMDEAAEARQLLCESLDLCRQMTATRALILILACTARLTERSGDAITAMQLRGAGAAVRQRLKIVLDEGQQFEVESELRAARHLLGEQRAQEEWNSGYALTDEGAALLARSILNTLPRAQHGQIPNDANSAPPPK